MITYMNQEDDRDIYIRRPTCFKIGNSVEHFFVLNSRSEDDKSATRLEYKEVLQGFRREKK